MIRMKDKELEGASDALGKWFQSQELDLLQGLQVMVRTINMQVILRAGERCAAKGEDLKALMKVVKGAHGDIAQMLTADATEFFAEAFKE
jgi:hypothetical protein